MTFEVGPEVSPPSPPKDFLHERCTGTKGGCRTSWKMGRACFLMGRATGTTGYLVRRFYLIGMSLPHCILLKISGGLVYKRAFHALKNVFLC